MARQVTTSEIAEMCRLRAEGLTYREIGSRVGRARTVVQVYAGDVEVPSGLPLQYNPIKASELKEMRRLRAEGFSFRQIERKLGRARRVIAKYAGDVEPLSELACRPVTDAEHKYMRRLRTMGLSFREIGTLTNRNPSVVQLHAGDITKQVSASGRPPGLEAAQRIERLYAACNRAVAEARV